MFASRNICCWQLIVLGRRKGLPGFPFEMSFKSPLKVPAVMLRHVFVYFSLEKVNSLFFFFFQDRETKVYILYHGKGKFSLTVACQGKKLANMTNICLMSPFSETMLSSFINSSISSANC